MMGVDWADLTWRQYRGLLWAWNDRHSEDGGKPEPDFTSLRRAMAAHTVQ